MTNPIPHARVVQKARWFMPSWPGIGVRLRTKLRFGVRLMDVPFPVLLLLIFLWWLLAVHHYDDELRNTSSSSVSSHGPL
jgi:hypothetical protein